MKTHARLAVSTLGLIFSAAVAPPKQLVIEKTDEAAEHNGSRR